MASPELRNAISNIMAPVMGSRHVEFQPQGMDYGLDSYDPGQP